MAEKYLANYRLRLVMCNVMCRETLIYMYVCIRVIFSRDVILVSVMGANPFCGKFS